MFTGIVECVGVVVSIQPIGTNKVLEIDSPISDELRVDQSLAHNGVCLTVTEVDGSRHKVEAVDETLTRSNLGELKVGDKVNLERSLAVNGRLDGHMVQGHVDQTGVCSEIVDQDGSWLMDFEFSAGPNSLVVDKGSICVNGVSLTCFNSSATRFSVSIIPYTFDHTNFGNLKKGDSVNLEFDILGKYVQKLIEQLELPNLRTQS